ncbi:hypothetical protein ACTFIV_001900 [Dictyostelium citrinum]
MQEKIKLNFEINNFNNEKYIIKEFTSKLIGIKENITTFKPQLLERYYNWAQTIEISFLKKNEKIEKSILDETFSYCSYVGHFLECEPFFLFLKFTTFGIILDDLIFEKILSLNMKPDEKEQLINSLIFYKHKNDNKIGFQLWEIINEFKLYTHINSFERIINANIAWIKSSIESRNTPINSSYSFNQYFNSRSSDVSGDFILTMCMVGINDGYIENSIFDSKEFQTINYHAKSFFMLINDLYSFNREKNEKDFFNYVKILAIQLNSIQISIDKTIELIIDHYLKFLSSIEIMLKSYEDDKPNHQLLKQVFENAKEIVYGIYFSHKTNRRYNSN